MDEEKKAETPQTLAAALIQVKRESGKILKQKKVTAGSFSYKYADLAAYMEAVDEAMEAAGLALPFTVNCVDGKQCVVTGKLIHVSCTDCITSQFAFDIAGHDIKWVGSMITYIRRYMLQCMLNVASEDDDGSGGQGNGGKIPPPTPRAAGVTPPQAPQDAVIPPTVPPQAQISDTLAQARLDALNRCKKMPEGKDKEVEREKWSEYTRWEKTKDFNEKAALEKLKSIGKMLNEYDFWAREAGVGRVFKETAVKLDALEKSIDDDLLHFADSEEKAAIVARKWAYYKKRDVMTPKDAEQELNAINALMHINDAQAEAGWGKA